MDGILSWTPRQGPEALYIRTHPSKPDGMRHKEQEGRLSEITIHAILEVKTLQGLSNDFFSSIKIILLHGMVNHE